LPLFAVYPADGSGVIVSYDGATSTDDGNWHFLTGTYDGVDTINLYVDGVPTTPKSGQGAFTLQSTSTPVTFGGYCAGLGPGHDFSYAGAIDEVRVYNRALPASEIMNQYKYGASRINTASPTLTNGSTLTTGLVGHWTFDGPDITTSVLDKSGNGNNGGFVGGATSSARVIGKLGQALNFNGSTAAIMSGTSGVADNLNAMSVALWFKTTDTSAQVLFSKGSDYNVSAGWYVIKNVQGAAGTIAFLTAQDASNWKSNVTTINYADGKWHHFVATLTGGGGGTITLYVDGAAVSTTGFNGGAVGTYSNSETIKIAKETTGLNFTGSEDDVRVYNRALSAREVKQLYNLGGEKLNTSVTTLTNGSTLTTGLLGHWTFDGADITTSILDKSGNGNNGGFVGGSTSSAKTIGKLGQALRFNGSNTYVNMGDINAMDGLTNVTVSAWIKSGAPGTNANVTILDKSNCTGLGDDGPFDIGFPTTKFVTFGIYNSNHDTAYQSGNTSTNVDDGKWHFLTGRYDGTNLQIWVDGVQEHTTAAFPSVTMTSTNNAFDIGGNCSGNPLLYNGIVDDTRVYNRALSNAEITQLYLIGK
jgi:hypothetical protein